MIEKNNLNAVFQYLKNITIAVDKAEFEYQFSSHPDYPSLLAVSDTLRFFKVNNMAFKISNEQIQELPTNFIALVKNEKNGEQFSFVQKTKASLEVDNKNETLENFTKNFQNIVLLAEKEEDFKETSSKNYLLKYALLAISATLLFITVCSYSLSFGKSWGEVSLLLITTLIGLYFSIETFRQILGLKEGLASKFCNVSHGTSCENVLTSKKWKLFEKVNLSDISIVFFASQTALLIVFALLNQFSNFLFFASFFLLPIIPISFLSIYYQWKVEKNWCPLCLAIIAVLYLEMFVVYGNLLYNYKLIDAGAFNSLKVLVSDGRGGLYLLLISVILLFTSFWVLIKSIFLKNKELKKQNVENLRFKRNYKLFKSQLLESKKIDFPITNYSIILGNKEADTTIQIITSPFCGHCKEAHKILQSIYSQHHKNSKIQIIFAVNKNDINLNLYRNLHTIYLEKGDYEFEKEMNLLFEDKTYAQNFIKNYRSTKQETAIDETLQTQNEFCDIYDFNFTPNIFINGYQYPELYERQELEFFISEVIEEA
ncbi:vitamin K epoxide reductase family protein [Chryseobacterium luteum]|uniref:Vitamin K epoxide reductase domain-containing protein n=1 Tax=Chryseobacterium luteum TaxID=421531 RepID=A0A085YZM1_9FLAO|nr:vitamin K epoxide reductase family protein [Chryseobacterium luteum]KFE97634.1 hypothetical protein IX38_20435 [Chryseobacterium luteum]